MATGSGFQANELARLTSVARAAGVDTSEPTVAWTSNMTRPIPTPQPRMARRKSRRVLRKTLVNHMVRLLEGLTIALVVAREDIFQAGFVTGQRDDRMQRCRFDHAIQLARHGQAQRVPIGKLLHLLHTGKPLEHLGWRGVGKGDGNFVALDVLQFGYAADAHQLPLADDDHAVAGLLHLAQDVRG